MESGFVGHHSYDDCPQKTIVIPRNRGCEFCRISVLPYRAKHCKECNRCVRKYDHHCFWIGSCVGELNHRGFYGFISLQMLTCLTNIDHCLGGWFDSSKDFPNDHKMQAHVQSIWVIFAFVATMFLLMTGGLTGYHTFLIVTAQTTWENSRREIISYLKPYNKKMLPFYVSIRVNIIRTFFHGGRCFEWRLRQPS